MSLRSPAEEPEGDGHPLAGVLDRLMSRERGATAPAAAVATVPSAPHAELRVEPAVHRMLVVAGLGPTGGGEALQALARWGSQAGLKIAAVDFGPTPAAASLGRLRAASGAASVSVPLASIPCGLDGLRRDDAGGLPAVAERLRCLEAPADLLLVRIPAADRQALSRGAFLAGSLIVPLDGGDGAVHAAFCLSREIALSLPGVSLVPYASAPSATDLYRSMVLDFLGVSSRPFEAGWFSDGAFLRSLAPSPTGGYLAALLAADPPAASGRRLLEMGALEI